MKITRSFEGTCGRLAALGALLLSGCGTGGSEAEVNREQSALGLVTISGTVTNGTAPLSGLTFTLAGSASGSSQSDSAGRFSFAVASGGSYSISAPQVAGCSFAPSVVNRNSVTTAQSVVFTGSGAHCAAASSPPVTGPAGPPGPPGPAGPRGPVGPPGPQAAGPSVFTTVKHQPADQTQIPTLPTLGGPVTFLSLAVPSAGDYLVQGFVEVFLIGGGEVSCFIQPQNPDPNFEQALLDSSDLIAAPLALTVITHVDNPAAGIQLQCQGVTAADQLAQLLNGRMTAQLLSSVTTQ